MTPRHPRGSRPTVRAARSRRSSENIHAWISWRGHLRTFVKSPQALGARSRGWRRKSWRVPRGELLECLVPDRRQFVNPGLGIRARPRRLPWVHSTIRVTREHWRNWSGELHSRPRRLYCDDAGGRWRSPRTLEDLQAIVRDARAEGVSIRVFGSSHSWAALVPNDSGYVVDNRMINSTDGWYNLSFSPGSADGRRKPRVTVPPGLLSS